MLAFFSLPKLSSPKKNKVQDEQGYFLSLAVHHFINISQLKFQKNDNALLKKA